MGRRVFLKLGGSLITDKRTPATPRLDVIRRLAHEVATARQTAPDLELVVGHGSGSYGHVVGRRYGTRHGVTTPEQWYGFAATGDAAAQLNRIVTGALLEAGLPAWSIQPGASVRSVDGRIVSGLVESVSHALRVGMVPVVYGDVVLDDVRGGTIASTEEIFAWLAPHLRPQRMVLAGEVDAIYTGDPQTQLDVRRIPAIQPETWPAIQAGLGGSHGVDVTGGMAAKVAESLKMVQDLPGLTIVVCGGLQTGVLSKVLTDPQAAIGTRIYG